ncbi:MAG: glycerophosphodiester phosphodiesterase family protein [Bryobacteraceae bacterium]|nr:glycerophosphodiester phosphodiesterase family protein [Bryobacteraceae bacterium]
MSLSRRAILTCIAAPAATRPIQVIAHRGEHLECPENTLPAIERAIALGADWVELDVRTTRDGQPVLMHNPTVDATTNGHGAVAELDMAYLSQLDAGAHRPEYAGTRVPSFDQALETLRGKCGLYLDAKQIAAPAIIAHLRRHRMLDRCVVYGGLALHRELRALGHSYLSMPEAVSAGALRSALREFRPKVIAFDRRDFRAEVITVAAAARKGIFVDRLGEDDNESAWREAIRLGATGIQTDHPGRLVAMLRP